MQPLSAGPSVAERRCKLVDAAASGHTWSSRIDHTSSAWATSWVAWDTRPKRQMLTAGSVSMTRSSSSVVRLSSVGGSLLSASACGASGSMLSASACRGSILAVPERAAWAAGRATSGSTLTRKLFLSSKLFLSNHLHYAHASNLSREPAASSGQLASGEAQLRTVSARWGSRASVFQPLPAQKSPQAQASISAPPASTSGKISS